MAAVASVEVLVAEDRVLADVPGVDDAVSDVDEAVVSVPVLASEVVVEIEDDEASGVEEAAVSTLALESGLAVGAGAGAGAGVGVGVGARFC